MSAPRMIMAMSLAGFIAAMATPATAQQNPDPAPVACPRAQQMNEQLQRMRTMHESMSNAATPSERNKLRSEQWQLMRQGMEMMRSGNAMGMGPGAGMQGRMGMHGGMGGGMGACAGERMGMMEMMMQMMMDRMESEPAE